MYTSSNKTDHRALYMALETEPFQRGPGYWKFNNQLLRNKKFLTEMNKELDLTIVSTFYKEPIERWEIIKKRIKSCAVEFSRNKTSEDKVILGNLAEIVDKYESRLPLTQKEDELLQKTKADLEDKTMERIKGSDV